MRVWTDSRNGRIWEVLNSVGQAMAVPANFRPPRSGPPPEERLHFWHPSRPLCKVHGSVRIHHWRTVDDFFSDPELQGLLDEALRKAAGE